MSRSTFRVTKDGTYKNFSTGSSLKIPSYSSDPQPVEGEIYYNTIDKSFNYSNGETWNTIEGEIVNLNSLGTGNSLVVGNVGPNLTIKSLKEGENVSITEESNCLVISSVLTEANSLIVKSNLTVGSTTDLCGNVLINCENGLIPELDWQVRLDSSNSYVSSKSFNSKISVIGNEVYLTNSIPNGEKMYNYDNTVGYLITETGSNTTLISSISKWDSTGNALWTAVIGNSSSVFNNNNLGYGIHSVPGFVYNVGSYNGTSNIYNADGTLSANIENGNPTLGSGYLVKFDDSGDHVWNVGFTNEDYTSSGSGVTVDVITDISQNVYVSGYFAIRLNIKNAGNTVVYKEITAREGGYVIKYDENGLVGWIAQTIDTNRGGAKGGYLSVSDTNIYTTGSFRNNVAFLNSNDTEFSRKNGTGYYIIKYNLLGSIEWVGYSKIQESTFSVPTPNNDIVYANRNVYTCFSSDYTINVYNPDDSFVDTIQGTAIVKRNSESGNVVWISKIIGDTDLNIGINSDSENNIYFSLSQNSDISIYNSDNSLFKTISNVGSNRSGVIIKYNENGFVQNVIFANNLSSSSKIGFTDTFISEDDIIYTGGFYGQETGLELIDSNKSTNIGTLTQTDSDNKEKVVPFVAKFTNTFEALVPKNKGVKVNICADTNVDGNFTVNNEPVDSINIQVIANSVSGNTGVASVSPVCNGKLQAVHGTFINLAGVPELRDGHSGNFSWIIDQINFTVTITYNRPFTSEPTVVASPISSGMVLPLSVVRNSPNTNTVLQFDSNATGCTFWIIGCV